MFIADSNGGNARQILVAQAGTHNHHPAWSPDNQWIYFTRGMPTANQMDLWRISASGGEPEQMTQHSSSVGYPTPIDARAVLYVSRDTNGDGPWLWGHWIPSRRPRIASASVSKNNTSVAASTDGRRVVATVGEPDRRLVERSDTRSRGGRDLMSGRFLCQSTSIVAALQRHELVLPVIERNRRWAVAPPGRTDPETLERFGRGTPRIARHLEGRPPRRFCGQTERQAGAPGAEHRWNRPVHARLYGGPSGFA